MLKHKLTNSRSSSEPELEHCTSLNLTVHAQQAFFCSEEEKHAWSVFVREQQPNELFGAKETRNKFVCERTKLFV